MELEGQVEDIIYQNEVNSYTIANISVEEELVTVVGYLPFVNLGDTLKVYGQYVNHQEYGKQFKISTFEKIMPKNAEALEKYLSSGIIKGVGPVTAKKIVSTFGEDTINVFKFEPEKLSQIKGITKDKSIEIAHEFNEKWELWQIVGFLERFGISASNCKKVYNELGNDAIEKIEKDPYILLDIVYGVDFKQVDKMAIDLGIDVNSEKRIESAIKYALIIASYQGHTCVLENNLISYIKDLINVDYDDIENCIINLKGRDEIEVQNIEENRWISLYPFYKSEKNIAERLIALQKAKNIKKIKHIKEEIYKQEQVLDIILSEKQKEAINKVNDNNVCVITGGPGTGKTTIIKSIIDIYKKQKNKVVLCAPTGRAAKRMSETTGEEASTIHRLLEIGKLDDDKLGNVDYDIAPIDADIIIVDEMSMVDVFLMNYILKGVYLGTKLILVGDSNQLPSVGPGSVLKDVIESEKIEVIELNKVFRQAAKSKIIVNAHNVNDGISFTTKKEDEEEKLQDFFYIADTSQEKMLNNVITLCSKRLQDYGDYDFFKQIQVLTPTKKGMLGTKELNKKLQEYLNPESEFKKQKNYGDTIFRVGDRIMQIKNNYDIFWEKKNEEKYETGSGIFNGEIGTVNSIDENERMIEIIFDDEKKAWYEYSELEQIEHAYAITIHKSQRK